VREEAAVWKQQCGSNVYYEKQPVLIAIKKYRYSIFYILSLSKKNACTHTRDKRLREPLVLDLAAIKQHTLLYY